MFMDWSNLSDYANVDFKQKHFSCYTLMATVTTDCHRSTMLSPRLDLPDFDLAPERKEKLWAIADLIWYSAGE